MEHKNSKGAAATRLLMNQVADVSPDGELRGSAGAGVSWSIFRLLAMHLYLQRETWFLEAHYPSQYSSYLVVCRIFVIPSLYFIKTLFSCFILGH
jgi:hypothetical protein